MYLTRNQAWVQIHRGFESHPLRQYVKQIKHLRVLFVFSPQISPHCLVKHPQSNLFYQVVADGCGGIGIKSAALHI